MRKDSFISGKKHWHWKGGLPKCVDCKKTLGDYRVTRCFKHSKMAKRNPQWKGNKAGYGALHRWARRHKPQPKICENCGKRNKQLDLANISGKYLRKLNDYEYLCRYCHMAKDGRLKKVVEMNKKRWL